MTSRSVHAGLVDLDPSLYRRENDPVCAQRVRDGVINGLSHKADSVSQVRINWQPPNEALTVTGNPRRWATGREEAMAVMGVTEWYVLEASPFGVIDLPRFGAGKHFEMRLSTAWGAAGQGFVDPPPAVPVHVRVFLYPEGYDPRGELDLDHDHVWAATYQAGAVGYSGDWITGATRGPGAYETKLVLTPEVAAFWRRQELVVPNAEAGGSPAPTEVLRVYVGVAASPGTGPDAEGPTVIPLMRALSMQGFVGDA